MCSIFFSAALAAEPAYPVTTPTDTKEARQPPGAAPDNSSTRIALRQEVPDYGFLEQQIFRGETDHARQALETIIAGLNTSGRYDEALVVPLTLLGDALMVQQEYDLALDQYDRARHISRVSHGLFNPEQLAIVYREADAFKKIGDLDAAGQREEYAYEVLHMSYGEYDPKLLPGLMRLGSFYLQTHNFLAARTLFNRAMSVHASNGSDFSLEAIPALHGIAISHRLERFPPFYIANSDDNRMRGPTPNLSTSDLENQHITFNNFPAGEKALQQIVEIHRRQDPENVQNTFESIIALADWHLMFGHSNTAQTLYSHVYTEMLDTDMDAERFFAKPEMLYLPKPHNPKPPPVSKRQKAATGQVTVSFNVLPSGRVSKMQTLASQPRKLMDFRVRRSMRLAVYRPRLEQGVAVTAPDQTYTHEFSYFPTARQVLTESKQNEKELAEKDTKNERGQQIPAIAEHAEEAPRTDELTP